MVDEIRAVVQDECVGRRGQLKKILLTNYQLLDENEKEIGIGLEKYEHYPVLKQAWLIKEKIVHFYQLGNYEKAKENFKYITMLFETKDATATWKQTHDVEKLERTNSKLF